ncbi:Mpo1 family 2-hydroxy fatty acid dioxygenase [Lacinutrix undariae]
MRVIDSLLKEYAESHQTKLNVMIHYICVPLIFFSLIGLLASIPVPKMVIALFPAAIAGFIHYGSLVIILGLFYYLRLSKVLFVAMLIFSVIVLYGVHLISQINMSPLWLSMTIIFVVSWIGQFIGHNHEGKKPSFIKDLQFLMIGPAWTMSHLFEALKIKF